MTIDDVALLRTQPELWGVRVRLKDQIGVCCAEDTGSRTLASYSKEDAWKAVEYHLQRNNICL